MPSTSQPPPPDRAETPAAGPPRPSLSAVVPVYHSEAQLPELLARLRPVLAGLAADYEIILVNDGSRDRSWEVIQRCAAGDPSVRGICLMRNYGQHNALLCGIRRARHELIVTLDDDLQNPPEEIARLLAALAPGVDVVYGTPERLQHGCWRNLASWITKFALQDAMGAATARKVSAFRLFRRDLRESFANYRSPYVSLDVLLTWATTRFAAVSVRHDPRRVGSSQYDVRRLIAHAIDMVTGFSTLPLQIASVVGFATTVLGVLVLGYVLVRYLISGGVVPGFAFLACTIAIFAGAQLFALGVIGEYLARMHLRLQDRPAYAVREETGPAS
jgi:glycosyltransferase involved in cell wall biosynthesis